MKHDVIKKSHLRSLEKGIAKDLLFPQKMLYGNDLQTLFHRKSLLIKYFHTFYAQSSPAGRRLWFCNNTY